MYHGLGPYTAGAVGSIAFGINSAAVDANVIRVQSRLMAWRSAKEQEHWELAESLVDGKRVPGDVLALV